MKQVVRPLGVGDPFANAGLFQSVEIRRWRKLIFNSPQD